MPSSGLRCWSYPAAVGRRCVRGPSPTRNAEFTGRGQLAAVGALPMPRTGVTESRLFRRSTVWLNIWICTCRERGANRRPARVVDRRGTCCSAGTRQTAYEAAVAARTAALDGQSSVLLDESHRSTSFQTPRRRYLSPGVASLKIQVRNGGPRAILTHRPSGYPHLSRSNEDHVPDSPSSRSA